MTDKTISPFIRNGATAKRAYLNRCMGQSAEWLRASAANPSEHMTRMHVALQLIAARSKDRIRSFYEREEEEA